MPSATRNQLPLAARLYAQLGYHVFPLLPHSKEPATVNGFHAATTNIGQVNEWWRHNPHYNIGLACGSSGLLILDFDTYKNDARTDWLFDDDDLSECVIVDTAHGGTHVWFKQPDGQQLTNSTGDLPDGIDVRGAGGYVVAPPSILDDGTSYRFRDGHRPTETTIPVVPQHIIERIAAFRPQQRPTYTTTLDTPAAEEIRRALSFIPAPAPYEIWIQVGMALHSTMPDDDGLALWLEWSPDQRPGDKPRNAAKHWRTFKRSGVGIGTLLHIAREHGYVSPHAADVREQLHGAQRWLRTRHSVDLIKERATKRVVVTPLISLLHVLVGYAIDRATTRVYITCRTLANHLATSGQSVHRQLVRLQELGLLDIKESDHGGGTVVDIKPLLSVTQEYQEENYCHAESHFHQEHVGDDAFATYPYTYAAKRRGAPLLPSLGATGLLLWPHLAQGGTVADLAEATGLSKATVKKACARFAANALVTVERVGRETYYALIAEAESRLDEVRPHMQTAWVGQMRVARNHSATADYAHLKLRQYKRSKSVEARTIAWWENLFHDSLSRAEVIFDFLESQGYDARMKVGNERPVKRQRSRYDFKEMWASWGHNLYQAYTSMKDLPHKERVRRLVIANVSPELDKNQFAAASKEMQERIDLMLMMSSKVKRLVKRVEPEVEAEPVVEVKPQMEFAFA